MTNRREATAYLPILRVGGVSAAHLLFVYVHSGPARNRMRQDQTASMRAVQLISHGGPEALVYRTDVPHPVPGNRKS